MEVTGHYCMLLGKVLYVRILRIHIRSVNPPLHSRQPWDLTPHSHHQRESRIHIRSRNPSSIHVSHGNLVDSLHQWEFSFNSQVGCESVSNSHWACESNLKLNRLIDWFITKGSFKFYNFFTGLRLTLYEMCFEWGSKKWKMMDSHYWGESCSNSHQWSESSSYSLTGWESKIWRRRKV